jgi:DNA-binding SARP family transcriptional activator
MCYLAIESQRGFQRRDSLLGLFWPELSQSQARQALRAYAQFAQSLGTEFAAEPSAETQALIHAVRTRTAVSRAFVRSFSTKPYIAIDHDTEFRS